MITRNFNLYLNAGHSVPLVINVNQFDSGEQWVFTLYNSDGTQYTPSTGAIVGIKSDGLGIINSGSVVDGKVVINETEQMTVAVGKAVFELLIDSQTHGTANFVVLVEEKPGNNADLSESDLSLLQEAIDATSPLPTGGSVGQVLTKTANGSAWSNAGTPTQEQVAEAVSDWADENITVTTGVVIDTSLAVAGAAADSKKVGDVIGDLSELETEDKTDLVSAINEAAESGEVEDNSVTTPKIVEHAVTMEKTDFYYPVSKAYKKDWFTYTTGNGFKTGIRIVDENLATAVEEFPDAMYIIAPTATAYPAAGVCQFLCRTSTGSQVKNNATLTSGTINVQGVTYSWKCVTKENFTSAYNVYLTNCQSNPTHSGLTWKVFGGDSLYTGDTVVMDYLPSADLIEAGYSEYTMSEEFATAVKRALESEEGTSTEEEIAKGRLTGKVMLCLGDSYTAQMETPQLSSLASKYGMIQDNRGVVSSSICGTVTGSKGYRPFWDRADTIVSDYTSGYTINGVTYTTDDVAIVMFMGGANDGFGIETWIGTGIHETSKETIYGACNYIFDLLAKTFRNAKLICITQPSNYNRQVSDITDDATARILGFDDLAELQVMNDIQFANYGMALKEEAVKKSAWVYGWNIIDMFNEFPTMFNSSNRSAYWSSDKIHLKSDGYAIIQKALDKKIVELVVG